MSLTLKMFSQKIELSSNRFSAIQDRPCLTCPTLLQDPTCWRRARGRRGRTSARRRRAAPPALSSLNWRKTPFSWLMLSLRRRLFCRLLRIFVSRRWFYKSFLIFLSDSELGCLYIGKMPIKQFVIQEVL